jgi:uncharacterized protein YndB with AHSA1/START domain
MPWTAIFTVIGILVALVVIALVIGSNLPREHVAVVRTRYAAPPAAVWSLLSDPSAAPTWRKDVKRVEKIPDINGHPAWKEESGFGLITYELVESTDSVSRTTRIADETLPYGGQWEHRLAPAGSGTELTITERGFVKPALFRFMSRYLFGYTATLKGLMTELGTKLGERVEPEVVQSGK